MSQNTDHPADLAQSWVSNADAWTAAVRGGGIESRRRVTDRAIVEAVLAQQPGRVLDLGCGEGWLVRALAKHGVEGVGIDGSPMLIEAARSSGGGTFHVCTYEELADKADEIGCRFGVISANFAILHEEVSVLLQTLRQLLAPRGKLVIQTLHPWSAGGRYCDGWREEDFRSFQGVWQPMPWYFRTLSSWLTLLRGCGYSVIDLVEPVHPDTQLPVSLLIIVE